MKVSELWLRDWVNPNLTRQELAHQLTMAGLEVDGVAPVAGDFTGVVVAKVLKTERHPQAEKLTLCEVDAGEHGQFKIVCGARNVRDNLNVALALPGATLPGDWIIQETHLRGELSQGMLCSLEELSMALQSDGIIELPGDAPLGVSLREYLKLDDHIFEISLTPNRADCFSVKGIARELSAITGSPFNEFLIPPVDISHFDSKTVKIKEPKNCPRYIGRSLIDLNPHAETPLWMAEQLRRAGLRPIHSVVDITNYVMLELGQPLHAFDLSKLSGSMIVRMSQPGESLTLLDGKSVQLTGKELVIADDLHPLALAGVMGGADSGVTEETTSIFLESAYFQPAVISGTARRFGLSSDAAMRFERGVDYQLAPQALERATQLMIDILGGKAGSLTVSESLEHLPHVQPIVFKPGQVLQLSGLMIEESRIEQIFMALGLGVEKHHEHWLVKVPSHRFDLQIAEDLVEEVIRLYGYDNIQPSAWTAPIQRGQVNARDVCLQEAGQYFSHRGYLEAISYSFVDPDLQEVLFPEKTALSLLNPISQDLSQMRLSLWPGLIAAMLRNIHRQQTRIALFETGVVFELTEAGLKERVKIAGLISGEMGTYSWVDEKRKFDFYDLKGDVEGFLGQRGFIPEFISGAIEALHPGKTARIVVGGHPMGWMGSLHPKIIEALDLVDEVFVFELDVEEIKQPILSKYQPISKYPQNRRDLSFLVSDNQSVGEMVRAIKALELSWLKDVFIFDVYQGKGVPEGQKSVAFALLLQAFDKTLVDAEINSEIDAIIQLLKDNFSAILRDAS